MHDIETMSLSCYIHDHCRVSWSREVLLEVWFMELDTFPESWLALRLALGQLKLKNLCRASSHITLCFETFYYVIYTKLYGYF